LKKRAQEQLRRLPLASKLNTFFSLRWSSVCLFNFSQLGFGRLGAGVVQICLPKKQLGKANQKAEKYCSRRAAA